MMFSSGFRKWKITAFATLAVFTGMLIFLLLPYAALVLEKYTLYNEQKAQISFIGNWQDKLSDYEEKQSQIEKDIESMVISLAGEREFSVVVEEILDHANRHAINLQNIQPVSEIDDGNYIKRIFRLHTRGGYHNTAEFINKLEQGNYLIIIKKYVGEKKESEEVLTSFIDIEITLLKKSG